MSFGLRVSNSQGTVQIDNSFENMVLIHQGVTTSKGTQSVGSFPRTPLPSGLSLQDVYICVGNLGGSERRVVLSYLSADGFIISGWSSGNPASFNVPYRIYASPSKATHLLSSADSFGMRVIGASGRVVYDSRFPALKVRGFIKEQYKARTPFTVTSTFADPQALGFSPWVGVMGTFVYHTSAPVQASPGVDVYGRGIGVTASGVVISNVKFASNMEPDDIDLVWEWERVFLVSD